MRQLVVGIVAAAALVSSGIAQARPQENRPGDRPNDFGAFGGGHAGSVVQASNPYRNVEGQGLARAQQRMLQKTNFHASRPSDPNGADTDRASMQMKALHGGGHGMAGSVKTSLNVYRTAEILGIQSGMRRAQQKTNFHAAMPADKDGADADRASRGMKAMHVSGSGGGMAGSVKTSLNVYRTAEILGIQSGMRRALQKTNQHAAMPADKDGAGADRASKQMKAMYVSGGGGGMPGAVKTSLNVYRSAEVLGMASAMRRAQQKTNFHAAMPADANGADADRASKQMKALSGNRRASSSIDLRNVSYVNARSAAGR